jgi:hypothetical protein
MVLAKRTSKNQLTLPKFVVEQVGSADYYEVVCEDGPILLTSCPSQRHRLGAPSFDCTWDQRSGWGRCRERALELIGNNCAKSKFLE